MAQAAEVALVVPATAQAARARAVKVTTAALAQTQEVVAVVVLAQQAQEEIQPQTAALALRHLFRARRLPTLAAAVVDAITLVDQEAQAAAAMVALHHLETPAPGPPLLAAAGVAGQRAMHLTATVLERKVAPVSLSCLFPTH